MVRKGLLMILVIMASTTSVMGMKAGGAPIPRLYPELGESLQCIAVAPLSNAIVAGSWERGVYYFEGEKVEEIYALPAEYVTFDGSGKNVALISRGSLIVWSVQSRAVAEIIKLDPSPKTVLGLCWPPGDEIVYILGYSKPDSTLYGYNIATGKLIRSRKTPSTHHGLYSAYGIKNRIYMLREKQYPFCSPIVVDALSGNITAINDFPSLELGLMGEIAVSPDGTKLAFQNDRDDQSNLQIVDFHGTILLEIPPPTPVLQYVSISWGNNGHLITFVNGDGKAYGVAVSGRP